MKKNILSPPKPHQNYSQLVDLLESRGLIIPDRERAERKLSQIGYYRLSGFWFPCREVKKDVSGVGILHPGTKQPIRKNSFQPGTDFNEIVQLYLFDKKLRLLMLDAIERIEIHIRSVLAHEVGYHDPLAYNKDSFINPNKLKTWLDKRAKKERNLWKEWRAKQQIAINRSKEDCIKWHKIKNKEIPFWVAVESWDFGTLSKYYSMLKGKYQGRICSRLGINNKIILETWLHEINILRNRCAHHTRIWNQSSNNPLPVLSLPYFEKLSLEKRALERVYGMVCILWFLVKKIGPSSTWLHSVSQLINSKPSIDCCPYTAMGFPDNTGFPDIENFS